MRGAGKHMSPSLTAVDCNACPLGCPVSITVMVSRTTLDSATQKIRGMSVERLSEYEN